MTEFIALDTSIELSKWDSAINQMIADAARVEKALNFNSVSIRVDVDDAALVDAVGLVDRLNAGSANVRIDATVSQELQNAQTLINRIDSEDATVTLDALLDPEFERAAQMVAKLDSGKATIDIDATVDTELKNAQDLINRLDSESADVEVTATDNASDVIKKIQAQLQNLQNLATISLVLDAAEFIRGINEIPFLSTINEQEAADAQVAAQTTRDIQDRGAIIEDTYTNAFGESRAEIAHFLVGMANARDETGNFIVANEDLADSVTGLFEAQNATMLDTEEIFQAATALVQNGLVPTYREAYDFITQGARDGLNVNNDMLASIDEYTLQFAEAGISAEGFYNVLRTSAETGQFQTDKAVDLIKESTNLAREEIEDFNQTGTLTPRVEQIQKLDLMEEGQAFAQGEITGEEWLSAVLSKIDELPTEAEKRFAELQIFGPTQVEEVGSGFLEALDFAKDVDWEGAATEGAAIMNDTMSVTLEETARTFDSALSAVLNNVIGQPGGFLDQLKGAALAFADEIQAGGTLGSAIELALQLPEGQIARIESAIGNFLIGILEVTANILDAVPGADSSGVRATLADVGAGQLTFDLQAAVSEEEITAAITRATNRGVEQADVSNAIDTAITEQLAAGDIAGAQVIVDSINAAFDPANLSEFTQQALEAGQTVEEVITMLKDAKADTSMGGQGSLIASQIGDVDAEIAKLSGESIRTYDYQVQIDAAKEGIETAYNDALANLDFSSAMDLGEQLDMNPAALAVTINTLFTDAFIKATEAGDIEGADALWEEMLAINPDFELAGDLQMLLHDAEQEVADTTSAMVTTVGEAAGAVTTGYTDITTASGNAADAVEEDTGAFSTGFNAISLGSMVLLLATGNYNALATAIQTSAPGMVAQLEQISNALSGFANAGGMALGVSSNLQDSRPTITAGGEAPSTGGKGGVPRHAAGGVMEGTAWVGEEGPELRFEDERVSILNNQTSEALWTAMQSMGARGGGSSSVHNTYNINVINNNASGAQVMSSTQALANKVRGF